MRVADAIREATIFLDASGDAEATQKSRLLMKHILEVDTSGLVIRENDQLEANQRALFQSLVERAAGEPVHRIIGFREFHGIRITLHPDTLEPRDDSEALIYAVVEHLTDTNHRAIRFADIGTGTGALALALLMDLPEATAVMTDIASGAIETAAINAKNHNLAARCEVREGPWLEPLIDKFDFIVSNPPYIASSIVDTLDSIVKDHDPRLALDGGADGLDAYRNILRDAAIYLKPHGFLALEIGYDQAESVEELAKEHGWKLEKLSQDLGGNDRAMIFTP